MAAADLATKKRKGASDAAPKAKKPRKSDDIAATSKPAKAPKAAKAAKAAPSPAAEKPAKKPARKQAEDFFSDNEAPAKTAKPTKGKKKAEPVPEANGEDESMLDFDVIEAKKETPKKEAPKAKATKAKKGKQVEAAPAPVEEEEEEVVAEAPSKKSKKTKSSKKQQEEPVEEVVEVDAVVTENGDVEDAAEEDDQTAALLAGFGSDDSDSENDIDFPEDDAVVPALTKSQKKAIAKAKDTPKSTEPGVVYIGRVPRGFFEPQMKKYFAQFGRVLALRLSRNKKTGASKHYAFVQFASAEVADIVARTMDNYLMFGHILKCSLIPKEQVHENLFKGAGTRFKVDPRNKKAGLAMERGAEREVWEKRVQNENKRRSLRGKALEKEFGYSFDAPKVKSTKDAQSQPALEAEATEPQQLLTETAAPAETKGKKGKKPATAKAAPVPASEPVVDEKTEPAPKKTTRKRKSDAAAEVLAAAEESVVESAPAKKAKKATAAAEEKIEKAVPKAKKAAAAAEEKVEKAVPKAKKALAVAEEKAEKAAPKAKKGKKAKA